MDDVKEFTLATLFDDKDDIALKRARMDVETLQFPHSASTSDDNLPPDAPIVIPKDEIQKVLDGWESDFEVLHVEGKLNSSVTRNKFVHIHVKFTKDGSVRPTHYVSCKECKVLLTNTTGGHMSRHKQKCGKKEADSNQGSESGDSKALDDSQNDSSNNMESIDLKFFRQFVGEISRRAIEVGRELSDDDFPETHPIRKHFKSLEKRKGSNGQKSTGNVESKESKDKLPSIFASGYANMMIETRNAKIATSLGAVHVSWLSEEMDGFGRKFWKQKVKFLVNLETNAETNKNVEKTFNLLAEKCQELGWSRLELKRSILCSVGGFFQKMAAESFSGHCPHSSSIFHGVVSKIIRPYSTAEFTENELKILTNVQKVVETIGKGNKASPIDKHRPFTQFEAVKDASEERNGNNTEILNENWEIVEAINDLGDAIKPFLMKYEDPSIFLNNVVLDLLLLEERFDDLLEQSQSEVSRLLAKTAITSVKYQFEHGLAGLHFAAVRLSPKSKKLTKIEKKLKFAEEKADKEIARIWECSVKELRPKEDPTTSCHHFEDDEEEQNRDLDEELRDYVNFKDDLKLPLQFFWPFYALKFPKLYCVARKVFGLYGNELLM